MLKAAAISPSNVCHSGKSRLRPAKKQKLQRLSHICDGILEPENRKVGQGVLTFIANVKVTYSIYRAKPFKAV